MADQPKAQSLKCPSCGAPVAPRGSWPVVKCTYCQTAVAVPEAFRSIADVANWTTVLHDTFATNANHWRAGVERNAFFDPLTQSFVDGRYRWDAIRGPRSSTTTAWLPESNVADFHCSVRCKRIAGSVTGSSWGMVFRVQDMLTYHVFRVSDSQQYAVAAVEAGHWRSLVEWKRSTLIKPGSVNQLSVLALDNHFDLSINGSRVHALDADHVRSNGFVGLALEMYVAGEHAAYDFLEMTLRAP